jgi:AraC-like DNA-binding protein
MRHFVASLLFLSLSAFTIPSTEAPSGANGSPQTKENPFMSMAGKRYAEYSQKLINQDIILNHLEDTTEIRRMIGQVEEVAEATGSVQWRLHAAFFELELLSKKGGIEGDDRYPVEQIVKTARELLEKAQRAGVVYLELIVRQRIIDYYWNYFQDYELAFTQYAIQQERLEAVSSEEIPEKVDYMMRIANAHYFFKDYPKAVFYYQKVLEERETTCSDYPKQHARNGIGLSLRSLDNDLDRSDAYFRAIMQVEYQLPEHELDRDNWDGIAQGNLGHNMLLRKEYDNAIPLLKSSIEKMLKHNDYAFASGPAVNLAEIYLIKGDTSQAKRYIDLSMDYYRKMPREGRLQRIYEVMSKYWAYMGNAALSISYLDSTLVARRAYDEQFNAMLLLRMEQKESVQREVELAREKERRQQMQHRLLILSGGFVVIVGLLAFLLLLYRRNRAAYRDLVRKSQQWASEDAPNRLPDGADFGIMREIEQLMLRGAYKDSALSLESLTLLLGAKRHYISGAINRCTQKNFNTFVNEFRIKEAVRLFSGNARRTHSVADVATCVGFHDTRNFLRVFKKMTGLTPSQFVNNMERK